MDRQYTNRIIIINETAQNSTNAAGAAPVTPINFESFRNVELEVVMTGFTGTVKFAGSNSDKHVDFGAAASLANPWDFVKSINQIDGTSVAGGTGLSGSATTSVTNLETNTNGFKWIGAIVSGYSAGTLTVRGKGYSNL